VNQVLVYHFAEMEGPPKDATAYGNDATAFSVGQGLPSVIGTGVGFSGFGDRITIPSSPSLALKEGFTFSAWIRITTPLEDAYLLARENGDSALIIGIDQNSVYGLVKSGPEDIRITEKTTDLSLNTWHHLTVVLEPGKRLTLYLDGIEMNWIELDMELPELGRDLFLGASAAEDHAYMGDLDEVRISKTPRSIAWIRAGYASQGPSGNLLAFGEEQMGRAKGGLPIFYLKTIFKNITLDGWTIIGILMIMAAASWMVFLSKALFLWLMARDNRAFLVSFGGLSDLTVLDSEGNDFENSPLYRVYDTGREELKKWIGNPNPNPEKKVLSAKGMNAIRTALERGYVEESQRLNAWLVIMTIAITGGPFLGLLGTVWGVMNTFAAMAEAGEANIMAIAPGVASALSTTVFGLIVAIPALFGYNYLAIKIKNMTAEMSVFIDQFALRADEAHGASQ
jgi:biopolymer transport protein ExbB